MPNPCLAQTTWQVPMIAEYARLYVKVLAVKLDNCKGSKLAKVCVGHKRFKMKLSEQAEPAMFSLTFHANLFFMLQVDCYETDLGIFGQKKHRGRAQIRVQHLQRLMSHAEPDAGDSTGCTGWWELRRKDACFLPLDELGVLPGDARSKQNVGAVQLWVRWVRAARHPAQTIQMTKETIRQVAEAEEIICGGLPVVSVERPDSPMYSSSPKLAVQGASNVDEAVARERSYYDPAHMSSRASLFSQIAGVLMSEDEFRAYVAAQALITAFSQGLEMGTMVMARSFLVLQKYYARHPIIAANTAALERASGTVRSVKVGLQCFPVMGRARFERLRHIYRYAVASYGWMGLNYAGKGYGIIYDMSRSQPDIQVALEYLQLPAEHLLYSQFESRGAFRPAFFVAYDRQQAAVVISVRGTMHTSDTLTDLCCDYIPWDGTANDQPAGDVDGMGFVHSGILGAAKWIVETVGPLAIAKARTLGAACIYVCGHSLGGGTAIMVALMLRGMAPAGLGIYCAAFGPPPVLSEAFIRADPSLAELIDVVVNDLDIVPSLSYGAAVDLQSMLVYASLVSSDTWALGELSDTVACRLAHCAAAIASHSCSIKLQHPGSVHLITTVGDDKLVVQVPHDFFNEIRIPRSIIFAHLPDLYESSLEKAYLRYLLEKAE